MGRWQASVSSEVFHRQTTKKRLALGSTAENNIDEEKQQRQWSDFYHHHQGDTPTYVGEEESQNYHYRAEVDERTSSRLKTTTTETTMCSGSSGDVAEVATAPPVEEEWSPIRESVPSQPQYDPFHHIFVEEQGASSDMDTEEDAFPLVSRSSKVCPESSAAATPEDPLAYAVDSNVGWSGAVAVSAGSVDRSGRSLSVAATAGEPVAKRKRLAENGRDATVEVTFEGLTRESKRSLQQALQTWASWHSRSYPFGMEATEEVLQSGTEVYSPALVLEPTSNTGPVSVWMDKPLKNRKGKVQDRQDGGTVETQDIERDVPLYDRACISALPSQDINNSEGYIFLEPEEAARCFNCGSYTHPLRNCPRPLVMAAIKQARDQLNSKRGPRHRTVSRYYQCSPGGKFDDVKPGELSVETRKAIGIGELDPPPWLNRMRDIGYPPGYLEDTEDDSSGLKIIDEDDAERLAGKESFKGIVEHFSPVEERKIGQKMSVDYPGINAPIPESADKKLWASLPETLPAASPRGSKRPYHQISQIHNSGSGLSSPNSPAIPWGVGNLREESFVRNVSSGLSRSNSRGILAGIESYIDVHGSNLYGTTSPVVNINGNLSFDPAHHWSKRRVSGTGSVAIERTHCYNPRSDAQAYHHLHSSPSGLASPIREMFAAHHAEHISSSHLYTRSNYVHGGHQGSPLPTPNAIASQAWLKAQSALDALLPTQSSGDLVSSLHPAPVGAAQHSRGPGLPHQWGRR